MKKSQTKWGARYNIIHRYSTLDKDVVIWPGNYSTLIRVLPCSTAFGTVRVSTPSSSLALTPELSMGRGSQTVRVKVEVPVKGLSVEIGCDCSATATVSSII